VVLVPVRYAGDGAMVVFNDPVPVENPALQAVLMALDMRTAIGALIKKCQQLGLTLVSGSVLRMGLRRWVRLDLRVAEITRRSGQCRTFHPGFAMRLSRAKSSSAHVFCSQSIRS
jgi:hypothetical protein